jgi:antitoxin ParD1/3/4
MVTLTISIPDQLKDWVDERVKSGRFSTADDYLRELIRQDQEQREALVNALIEGEQSGISTRTVSEIIADAKATISNGQV